MDEIQVACYKLFHGLYQLGTDPNLSNQRSVLQAALGGEILYDTANSHCRLRLRLAAVLQSCVIHGVWQWTEVS